MREYLIVILPEVENNYKSSNSTRYVVRVAFAPYLRIW